VRERWAWEWARANALIWTPRMENSARKAVKWYARHAAWIDRRARLKRSAHHEAGHAVIARVLGLLGGAATIAANHMFQSYGGSESYLAETMEHWRRPISEGGNKKLVRRSLACAYRAKVMMSMAGREAELECLGTSRSSDRFDLDDIDELMPKVYPGASRAEWSRPRDRLRRMTRALVRRHRDKIERLACALLRHRTLSGKAIDALLPEIPAPATHCVELAARERERDGS
jgi:hypothetical protein